MTRRRPFVIAAAAFLVALAALAGLVVISSLGPGWSSKGLAPGERIFRYGLDSGGRPIPRSGGMMMMSSGCAGCHGRDGRGRTTRMYAAPDITYANLTDPQGMLDPDGTRGPAFTDAALRTAVTEGVDPEGDHLSWPMPRWNLTDAQWADLLAYLKSLL
ncbi:MAG: c-type cytochrome [Thermoleophilia bacterium]